MKFSNGQKQNRFSRKIQFPLATLGFAPLSTTLGDGARGQWPDDCAGIPMIKDVEFYHTITSIYLETIPPIFRTAIQETRRKIPKAYPDTQGLVLIGSVAEGSFKSDSDVDIVWIKSRKLSIKKLYEFKDKLDGRIQLIPFTRRQLEEHFRNSTTMAHAIKNGIVLYQKGGFITKLLGQEITLPDREWMKKWFEHWTGFYRMGLRDIRRNKEWHKRYCKKRCTCEVGDYLARATVNFAILFSELCGFVPTTKDKVLKGFKKFGKKDLIPGLRVALQISRQDRPMSRKEAETIYPTAKWLRHTLARRLRS